MADPPRAQSSIGESGLQKSEQDALSCALTRERDRRKRQRRVT